MKNILFFFIFNSKVYMLVIPYSIITVWRVNKMGLFFKKDYDTNIIEEISLNDLESRLNIEERLYPINTNPEKWAYFSYLKGIETGLNYMYAVNFGYILSSFIAGMGVDAGTDMYFKLGIDDAIFDLFDECNLVAYKEGWTEEQTVQEFFHRVLLFYKSPGGACKYEKAVFNHNVRVGTKTKEWFLSQKQSSKQTLNNLIEDVISCPGITDTGKEENITFKFTYSEEELWNKLDGETDTEKLRGLLSE